MTAPATRQIEFSLVEGDPFLRLMRAIHLVPAEGLGIRRRLLAYFILGVVPLVLLAALAGRLTGGTGEPLRRYYGIHALCLVAIPLLVLADALGAHLRRILLHFLNTGLVVGATEESFQAILRRMQRLKDSVIVHCVIVLFVVLVSVVGGGSLVEDELAWAASETGGGLGLIPAGWWLLFVLRPLFGLLLLVWVWRGVIVSLLFWRLARLDLQLVPTHPDRAGGLGCLDFVPPMFAPVILAVSSVIWARMGHNVVYHAVPLESLRMAMGVFVVAMLVLSIVPLLFFSPLLARTKRRATLEYGLLLSRHGGLVRRRWILGEHVEDHGLLSAPELGPVVDTISMYESILRIRPASFGRRTILLSVLSAAVPILPVLAIEVPLKDVLLILVKALL